MAVITYVNKDNQYTDDKAREYLIRYMLRPDKTRGHYFGGFYVNPNNPIEDMQQLAASYGKDSGVRIHHFVISFQPGKRIHMPTLNTCAQTIALEIGQRYQSFYSIHQDCDHIHIHLVFNSVSWVDGSKFRADHAGLRWVEGIVREALQFCGEKNSCLVW